MEKIFFKLLILVALFVARPLMADELVSVDTREGVSQGFLLLQPNGDPVGTVLMFPPHEGRVKFKRRPGGRFKVKRGGWLGQTVQQFVEDGFTVAIVEPPSDRPDGIEEGFRLSREHAEDMRQLVAYLTKRTGKKPFLAGTCRSTYSVASVAGKLDNRTISGVILASTRTRGRKDYGPITEGVRNGAITAPMLFVHHEDDDCRGSPYDMVSDALNYFRGSAKTVNLVTVKGGYESASRKQKRGCGENGSHKFYGAQIPTVDAILGWMRGKNPPSIINAGS